MRPSARKHVFTGPRDDFRAQKPRAHHGVEVQILRSVGEGVKFCRSWKIFPESEKLRKSISPKSSQNVPIVFLCIPEPRKHVLERFFMCPAKSPALINLGATGTIAVHHTDGPFACGHFLVFLSRTPLGFIKNFVYSDCTQRRGAPCPCGAGLVGVTHQEQD